MCSINYLLEPQSKDASRANDVTNILCDRKGQIWVTSLGGLYEFNPAKEAFVAFKNNPSDSAIHQFEQDTPECHGRGSCETSIYG